MAALMVFAFHITSLNVIRSGPSHEAFNWIAWLGLYGVSFFFVLSGFVLVWSARPADTRRAFWQRRFAKIVPNHVVTWAVVLLIGLAIGERVRPAAAVTNLFLLQAWVNDRTVYYSVNTVSWTLCCEMFFYLSLPFALPLVRRMSTRWLYAVVIAVPFVIYAVTPLTQHLADWDRWWLTEIFPPTRSLEFWLGVVAAELMLRRKWRGPGLWTATAIYVGVFVLNHWISPDYWTADLAVAFLLVITAGARADIEGTWSPWRSPVMVWLGEVSFAFYLVHLPVITNARRLFGHSTSGWPAKKAVFAIAFFLGLSILLAWLLYRFVERPMMRVLRPRKRIPPVPAQAGVPAQEQMPEPAPVREPVSEPAPIRESVSEPVP